MGKSIADSIMDSDVWKHLPDTDRRCGCAYHEYDSEGLVTLEICKKHDCGYYDVPQEEIDNCPDFYPVEKAIAVGFIAVTSIVGLIAGICACFGLATEFVKVLGFLVFAVMFIIATALA